MTALLATLTGRCDPLTALDDTLTATRDPFTALHAHFTSPNAEVIPTDDPFSATNLRAIPTSVDATAMNRPRTSPFPSLERYAMRTSQGSMLQSLRSVEAFLDTNAEALGGVVKTGARQQLVSAIAALSGHASDQSGSNLASQGATRKQRSLREALLRDHMAPISRIARADLPVTVELEPFKMPAGKPTVPRLAAAANGMAQAAGPFTPVFTSAGLPLDFVAQLNAATDAMVGSVTERMAKRGIRGGATTGLRDRLSAGRRIVHVLDAFVKSALKDNPSLLANWNVVKRVQKTTGRAAVPVVPPVTPAPTPTLAPTVHSTPVPPAAPAAA